MGLFYTLPKNYFLLIIESMGGSDPDAALYYLARMLEAGEDVKISYDKPSQEDPRITADREVLKTRSYQNLMEPK